VKLLVENSRLTVLPEIAEQFHALKNAREGRPTRDHQRIPAGRLADERTGRRTRTQVRPQAVRKVAVDPSLIGGVSVKVGDEVLDTSVRARWLPCKPR
jgi:F-type H+-transporting ATPase subunit delta